MSWPVTSTRIAYENQWIVVHEDQVVRPDGSPGVYGVVELRHPAVFVVAVTDADEVVLVTVDRHTVGRSVEVPAGGTDGEDALVAAQRELLEEAGLTASSWQHVGTMHSLNGVCRAPGLVYLATGLSAADGDGDHHRDHAAEEGISAVERIPLPEVLARIAAATISDGESVAALMFALVALGRVG